MVFSMNTFSGLTAILAVSLMFPWGKATSPAPVTDKPIHVIFDLNGVLLGASAWEGFKQLGLFNILNYVASMRHSPSKDAILAKLYEILNLIQPEANPHGAYDHDGRLMPSLMCDWQTGRKTPGEIRALVTREIKAHQQWFACTAEQILILKIVHFMFTPANLAKTVTVEKKGLKFLRECKAKGYGIHIISNWDAESIELIMKKHKQIFDACDTVTISARVGFMKPQPEIFQLYTSILDATRCIFIDDQLENVRSAQACGMNGVHCAAKKKSRTPHWKKARKKFARLEHAILNQTQEVISA